MRYALGASRRTIFIQMLRESILLGVGGGALGIALGHVLLRALISAMPPFTLPWTADLRLNLPVLLFTLFLATFAGLLFSCVPAWYASQSNPGEALKGGGSTGLAAARLGFQRMLVVGELALSLSLITGAGLAVHSFINLMRVDMGVKTDHVLTFYLGGPADPTREREKVATYYTQMLSSIKSIPGVIYASAQTRAPLFPPRMVPFTIAGKPTTDSSDSSQNVMAGLGAVTPEYFETFGIRILRGRGFSEQDLDGAVKVAVVNESFANTYLSGTDPLRSRVVIQQPIAGNAMRTGPSEWQIVGLYHDVRSGSMRKHIPEIQIPFLQSLSPSPVIAVRTTGVPEAMVKSLAAGIRQVDPLAFVAQPRTMDEIRTQVLSSDRFTMVLFVSFGVIALLLASLGVYGLASFSIVTRTSEIALRISLGASRRSVIAKFIKEGLALVAIGLALGLIGANFVEYGMRSTLFGVGAIDPVVLLTVVSLLLLSTLLACFLPSRRATLVDPIRALRSE